MTPDDLVFCSAPFLHVPLLDRLAPARAAGFAGISVAPGDIWALEAQGVPARDIAARIADVGLALAEMDCIANWLDPPAGDDDLARQLRRLTGEDVIATAARLAARSVAVIDLSPAPASLDRAAQAFAGLCALAAPHGLNVHIEFMPIGGIRSLAQAWAIVAAAGCANGGITLDAWHFHRSGSTLEQLAAIPGDRIHAVQLCDALPRPQADAWAELMTHRLLPGEGAIDLVGLVRTLGAIGCRAPAGVEVFHQRQAGQSIERTAQDWATSARAILDQARSD